jgi:hypothetical protein
MQGISANIPPTSIPNKVQMRSSTADTCNVPSLPCQSLRQELKQAILQRRLVQGKTMIDLTKEENERKAVLQSIKVLCKFVLTKGQQLSVNFCCKQHLLNRLANFIQTSQKCSFGGHL